MKRAAVALAFSALLAGCGAAAAPIAEHEYKTALGRAVCAAVAELNAAGILAETEKFGDAFEAAVVKSVREMGYTDTAWLTAKAEFFTLEEHEKLLKMHFTWCLINGSLTE